jgi:hypothetical protein
MTTIRLLACGSREFTDARLVNQTLDAIHAETPVDLLIEGEARGADTLALEWATSRDVPVRGFPADWGRYGKGAGVFRNQAMLDVGKPNLVVAFHDHLATSKGTADMVRRAVKAGVPVRVISSECLCAECGEVLRAPDGATLHPGCCEHRRIEEEDLADGSREGIAHDWHAFCVDCGSEVVRSVPDEDDRTVWEVL